MVGEGAALLVRRALAAAGLDPEAAGALDRFLSLYDVRLLEHTAVYEGTVDVLERLGERVRLSVLTNKPQRPTERILEGLGLQGYFGEAIGGDTPFGRKPDPAGLLHLAAAAGVAPDETLMIGDSPIDLQTARNAGTGICLVRYGFGYRFDDADFRGDELFADRPADLLAMIRPLK
jgi:phosphoglycolate phosphatase